VPACRGVVPGWGDGGVSNGGGFGSFKDRVRLEWCRDDLREWRERALAAEARVRDLEETVGELVCLVDGVWRA
jgi:hypothetical protein